MSLGTEFQLKLTIFHILDQIFPKRDDSGLKQKK